MNDGLQPVSSPRVTGDLTGLRFPDIVTGNVRRPVKGLFLSDVPLAPSDPILQLAEQVARMKQDNSKIIDCVLGEYQDDEMQAVSAARRLIDMADHRYGPMTGYPSLCDLTTQLLFSGSAAHIENRVASMITAGGTSANFLTALTLRLERSLGFSDSTVYVTDPTWGNHRKIWGKDAGNKIEDLPYYDRQTHTLRTDELLSKLDSIPNRSIILLHASCHNPTGQDPTPAEWHEIATKIYEKNHLLVLDMAYLGYADGAEEDTKILKMMVNEGLSFFVCFSFSKFMGLYGERTGAVLYVGQNETDTKAVISQLGDVYRGVNSNSPIHGQKIARAILSDAELLNNLNLENRNIRAAIKETRGRIAEYMEKKGYEGLAHIRRQHGLFSPIPDEIPHLELRKDPLNPMYTAGQRLVFNMGLKDRVEDVCEALLRAKKPRLS